MKIFNFIILFIITNSVHAFSMNKNLIETSTITWKAVDNVLEACNNEALKRGYPKYTVKLDACSFWKENECLILTPKSLTHDTLAHEVRHCFSGNWHK
jgi:hypothetical protein